VDGGAPAAWRIKRSQPPKMLPLAPSRSGYGGGGGAGGDGDGWKEPSVRCRRGAPTIAPAPASLTSALRCAGGPIGLASRVLSPSNTASEGTVCGEPALRLARWSERSIARSNGGPAAERSRWRRPSRDGADRRARRDRCTSARRRTPRVEAMTKRWSSASTFSSAMSRKRAGSSRVSSRPCTPSRRWRRRCEHRG